MNKEGDQKGNVLIGEGVTASSSFNVPGKAMINGSLDGELFADELTVGPHGKLLGKVRVRRADVHGESHESITASEHLIIRSTGQIHGVAAYGQIEIERGGVITGNIAPVTRPPLPVSMPAATDSSKRAPTPSEQLPTTPV
ncbi:MAG: polymer-forming cytoskeletal protein [Hydrogenophaga sp.]|uniref:bactofilin family protein n=1 Tax=Hydrogenophaga sp. TaxID=1904254 RepID=UPI002ABB8D54|nr:polymer-forming cytoskeletal protein [Hydrogenophaga sp.]MDZ4100999.1 polymer-forming cytoskeletal protein [Hydrogenophaga sp.]MDZ4239510.1 polymer-forming cytoskeletal protein [Hydrogenophaga sp.]